MREILGALERHMQRSQLLSPLADATPNRKLTIFLAMNRQTNVV